MGVQMFSCSAFLFLGIAAWLSVSLQNSQKAHEKSCSVSFGKTGWKWKERKKSVRMFQLYWDLEMQFRIYLFVSQLRRDKELIWG